MGPSDFDYELPDELIAQYPLKRRDSSRLLKLDRSSGAIGHHTFQDIKGFLRPEDILVLNDTRVFPARLIGKKVSGGKVELFLVKELPGDGLLWEAMVKGSKGVREGARFFFDKGLSATLVEPAGDGLWVVRLFTENGDIYPLLETIGKVPLPPYIKREPTGEDRERYQTVFAGPHGAVAAPTAGLHFTPEMITDIEESCAGVLRITLHTGPGTFMPVRVSDVRDHRMHSEYYEIEPAVFDAVMKAKSSGGRVVAVGTTATRALEAAARNGADRPVLSGETDIFIYPGYDFKVVDALLTNFHLPGSTLIMLVSAFAGTENILAAYGAAVRERYRFFSYGDAMLII